MRSSRSSRLSLAAATLFVAWGWFATAHAETCPDVPDDEVALRRSMAKEWFAKAEEAEAAGDKQSAVRRYACSLNLAPHPSTAYNLGTVAEKSGDLSMAVDGFRSYLKLAPEATDRPAIEARIARLEEQITELRRQLAPKPPEPAPAPSRTAATTPAAPPPGALPPAAPRDDGTTRHMMGWIAIGGAAAMLATGVVFNLEARSKMDECYRVYKAGNVAGLDRCDEAKPFAYASYGLFGAGAALGAVGGALLLMSPAGASDVAIQEGTELGLVPTAGGAAVFATGHF
jgi:hypothetical protein